MPKVLGHSKEKIASWRSKVEGLVAWVLLVVVC